MTPEEHLQSLIRAHDQELPQLKELDAHYEGTQPLNYLHPELLRELEDRLQQVIIHWPELVVGCLDERLDLLWFRVQDTTEADAGLEEIWQYNDLDEWSEQGNLDALVMRRSFGIIGANDVPDEPPIVTIESPLEVHAEFDPRTRAVRGAVKRWTEQDGDRKVEHATLYQPDETSWFLRKNGDWVIDPDHEPDRHGLGVVPVVPIVNRPRLGRPGGKSELSAILPLSNAANKIATDMMVSAEFHAMPRRWALGFGPEDFTDEEGRKVSTWSKIAGRIWATAKSRQDGAEVGQFPEANLENFHQTMYLLATLVGSLGALPPHYMGLLNAANPASADAIRSAESRLVKRAERRQQSFGNAYERIMRIADRVYTGTVRKELRRLEAIWRDASTPTVAQSRDAATKTFQAGIVPLRQTREDLGYTAAQIARMEQDDEAAAERAERAVYGPLKPVPEDPDRPELPAAG